MGKLKTRIKNYLIKALDLRTIPERGWYPIITESFLGAFQTNDTVRAEVAISHPTVYACVTQIAGDLGKIRLGVTRLKDGIWEPASVPRYTNVLEKPNRYQTRQKFIETWLISKLNYGNTYVLKQKDNKGNVTGLYILDPQKVTPLVSANGFIFYRLSSDNISGITDSSVMVPASELIHDSMECLFHPLIGVPPMYAASLATLQGMNIINNSSKFFGNNSQPGGILTAPGAISDDTANRLKAKWDDSFTGDNAGKVAVLGDGLTYEALSVNASDSQLIEQLKWSDEKICSVFKVPPYKVFVGPTPTYQNVEILDRIYYSGCLQKHIEAIEILLDNGLGLPADLKTEFNLDDLIRMDTALRMKTQGEGVKNSIITINEARKKFNLPPVKGGETVYMQQQNYSLEALAQRDATNPLAVPPPAEPPPVPSPGDEEEDETTQINNLFAALYSKNLQEIYQ